MKMPMSEILDRYTITKLKSERTEEDVTEELAAYESEIKAKNADPTAIQSFIDRLYKVNGDLWYL